MLLAHAKRRFDERISEAHGGGSAEFAGRGKPDETGIEFTPA